MAKKDETKQEEAVNLTAADEIAGHLEQVAFIVASVIPAAERDYSDAYVRRWRELQTMVDTTLGKLRTRIAGVELEQFKKTQGGG